MQSHVKAEQAVLNFFGTQFARFLMFVVDFVLTKLYKNGVLLFSKVFYQTSCNNLIRIVVTWIVFDQTSVVGLDFFGGMWRRNNNNWGRLVFKRHFAATTCQVFGRRYNNNSIIAAAVVAVVVTGGHNCHALDRVCSISGKIWPEVAITAGGWQEPGLDFINVLRTAFKLVVPQSVRTQSSRQYLFTLLGCFLVSHN